MSRIAVQKLFRISVLTGVGFSGYFFGRYHEKSNLQNDGFCNDMPGIPVFPTLLAASPILENRLAPIENVQPEESKPSLPVARTDDINVSTAVRVGQIMKYGFPSLDNIRSLDDFVLSYDRRNRVANWVFEHLTPERVKYNENVDRSKCDFFEDQSIHPFFRSTNSDYKKSGFDRGHLAAAGNHKGNQRHCEQTFVLSNMAPQVGNGFNRHSWNRLEKHVRKLTKNHPNVYVCTGPLYLPKKEDDGKTYIKYQVIGANTVAVPTHFFKVVVMEAPDSSLQMEAYVMPNQVISDDTPLNVFQVPLESIERASGLLIFDKLPKDKLKKINGKNPTSSWF